MGRNKINMFTINGFTEFAEDLNMNINKNKNIKNYAVRNFKNIRVSTAKVVAGTAIITAVAVGPKKKFTRKISEPHTISTHYEMPTTYIVQPEDRLFNVYLKTGVREEKIKELNDITDGEIHPGQVLRLI